MVYNISKIFTAYLTHAAVYGYSVLNIRLPTSPPSTAIIKIFCKISCQTRHPNRRQFTTDTKKYPLCVYPTPKAASRRAIFWEKIKKDRQKNLPVRSIALPLLPVLASHFRAAVRTVPVMTRLLTAVILTI